MRNKKAALSLDKFAIGFVIFSIFVVIGVTMIADINTNYETSIDTNNFNSTYNVINQTYDLSQDIKDDTVDADISDQESWQSMAKGSYSAVRLMTQTFNLIGAIMNDIAITLGISAVIVKFAITIISLAIFFAIIYLVMGVIRN